MSITKLTTNGVNGTKYDTVSADNYYMEPIATTLLASSAGSITFSNIPQGYKHLQIRAIGRRTGSATGPASEGFQFNGDTGSNYTFHYMYGTGASVVASASTPTNAAYLLATTGGGQTSNCFGVSVIDILDYSNVYKFKTCRSLSGSDTNSGTVNDQMKFYTAMWMNTAPITSIVFAPSADSFAANTRISLYGVKA